ncbi:hypothetical protein DSO57_1013924 [Entomophthora muscae]|uniref:Uncharacterized protein n=1 Tax=Entomophthora muscae TaxID=34485 RepID=A0ACC2USN5_9FUNG|nr:hypothetical protein DSO57_1013924 [Entomophthora muscae]
MHPTSRGVPNLGNSKQYARAHSRTAATAPNFVWPAFGQPLTFTSRGESLISFSNQRPI